MNVLIIEDEGPAARRLIKLLSEVAPEAKVVGQIASVRAGEKWFEENPEPDLILSDIQLSDDLSFALFRKVQLNTPLIFTTAYDEYAIRAFEHNSIDYLLKPVAAEKLRDSLQKFKDRVVASATPAPDFDALLRSLKGKTYRQRFLVSSGYHLLPLACEEVAYCFADSGRTYLISRQGKNYQISDSLDQLEDELDPRLFFRANRQFLLSAEAVQKVEPWSHQKLKVIVSPNSDKDLIVSKLRANAFKAWLGH